MTKLPQLSLEWTWKTAPAVAVPEIRATWAELEIRVGPECLTLVTDQRGNCRFAVYCSLYPMAEWIAFNWWSLLADAKPASQISQLRFAYQAGVGDQRAMWVVRSRRHVLRAAGDGFVWPDLFIVPEGRLIRLIWFPDMEPAAGRSIRYVCKPGNRGLDSDQVAEALRSFVDAVIARLDEQGVTGTPLHEEWAAIRQADDEVVAYCLAAARLGLDPYSDAARYESDILLAQERLDGQLAVDFFDAVRPELIGAELDWLDQARALLGPGGDGQTSAAVAELRRECADLREAFAGPRAVDPWQLGYDVAERVRQWAGIKDTEPFDPAALIGYQTLPSQSRDRGIVALATRSGPDGGPTLVAARRFTDRPRRFLLARALWHLICDEDEIFMIAASHTHRQHVARAFALEVLAPAKGVSALLGNPSHVVSSEDLEVLSDDYDVSTIVVEHQVDNRVLAPNFRP